MELEQEYPQMDANGGWAQRQQMTWILSAFVGVRPLTRNSLIEKTELRLATDPGTASAENICG
jgi:hypothetical protein